VIYILNKKFEPQCLFCGASIGEISEITSEPVDAIYDCPKCMVNYCSECSYEKVVNGEPIQFCLRCDSRLDKVSD
jgi:hypothetical protein